MATCLQYNLLIEYTISKVYIISKSIFVQGALYFISIPRNTVFISTNSFSSQFYFQNKVEIRKKII